MTAIRHIARCIAITDGDPWVVIPSWDHRLAFLFRKQDVPEEHKDKIVPGMRFFVTCTIDEHTCSVDVTEWEFPYSTLEGMDNSLPDIPYDL